MHKFKFLQVAYPKPKTTLFFCTEDIQEIVVKSIDIRQLQKLTGNDFQDEADHYIEITNFEDYASFCNIIYEKEDSHRFMDSLSVMKNGFSIEIGLNLTTVRAVSEEQLFEFISPCFDAFGFDSNRCCELIKSQPNDWLVIYTDCDGVLIAEELSDELLESCREKQRLSLNIKSTLINLF